MQNIQDAINLLKELNKNLNFIDPIQKRQHKLQKVIVANRGEIAKRFFLVLKEEKIHSVAIVTDSDRNQSWYEFADEVVYIGDKSHYINKSIVVGVAILVGADAVYPGYGFLSEDYEFVEMLQDACKHYDREIQFMGPKSSVMRKIGNKLDARKLAQENGVPLFLGSQKITQGVEQAKQEAEKIGYPVIIKLDAGGGGKGMFVVNSEDELEESVLSAQRIGKSNYDNDDYYLEKFITEPVHIEVQIFNGVAVGIRKCAVQRRNQKVIEESGHTFLDDYVVLKILSAAENMAFVSGYKDNCGAGTVEFLYDAQTNQFGFLEMNARLQVEYAVTDQSLGIDLAKWQILLFDQRENEIPFKKVLRKRFIENDHTIQCRIYAEDSFNDYTPSPGLIKVLEVPTFNGIRCDFGFKAGDEVLPDYDPMIGKLIAHGSTREEAIARITRALSELYIKGITSNVDQLLRIVRSKPFIDGSYTNRILVDNDELFLLDKNNSFLEYKEEAAIFGTIAEYVSIYQKTLNSVFYQSNSDIQKIISGKSLSTIPIEFKIEISDNIYHICLIQNTINSFEVLSNGQNRGFFKVDFKNINVNELLITHNGISYPVRRDKRPSFINFRIINQNRETNYYRMKITALGNDKKEDSKGMVRSPFQGSFVRLFDISVGANVKKGDPIMVISAMKMETTLYASVDGKINYIVENGDLSKLITGYTASGLVKGRTLSEGEILFTIEDESQREEQNAQKVQSCAISDDILANLKQLDRAREVFLKQPNQNISTILNLINSIYTGLIIEPSFIDNLSNFVKEVPLNEVEIEAIQEKQIVSIIKTYCLIKTIFSHTLSSSLSYMGEINQTFVKWDNKVYKPSAKLENLINQLFRKYNVENLKHGKRSIYQKVAFFNMMRAYVNAINYPFFIKFLLNLLSLRKDLSKFVLVTLDNLIQIEEVERDDFLIQAASKIISNQKVDYIKKNREDAQTLSQKYFVEYARFLKEPIEVYNDENVQDIQSKLEKSLKNPEKDLIPSLNNEEVKNILSEKIQYLSQKHDIKRLYSYYPNVLVYFTKNKEDGTQEYIYFVYPEKDNFQIEKNDKGEIVSCQSLEKSTLNAIRTASIYKKLDSESNNRLEFLLNLESIELDLMSNDSSVVGYNTILNIFRSILRFFFHIDFRLITLDILAQESKSGKRKNLYLELFLKNKQLQLDYIPKDSQKYPYCKDSSSINQRLYEKDKWPVEIWADLCFEDKKTEILIECIDDVEWTNPKTNMLEKKPVGAKIYEGTLNGNLAIFFMKDSRISGGATGDLEGLKFAASCYYAYLKDEPLYVWNDGAGANIKEGVISLNRAAIGFMMNALLTHSLTKKEFFQYTKNVDDKRLIEVFNELDTKFNFSIESTNQTPKNCFLVAIGIGSSTGLDVYGSSQAAIQILLDNESSYRVLTGSNVIKSVTGEDLTNYEIGGARIMGNWTGTVDLIAKDKISMLRYIYNVQNIFYYQKTFLKIQRNDSNSSYKLENQFDVIDEKVICSNVDDGYFLPFKSTYYNTGSLIGGFAKISGNKTLILGTRTNFGFRASQSVLKAKELIVTAKKTDSNAIFIFGENWYQPPEFETSETIRARLDFINQFNSFPKVKVNIITHIKGLQLDTLNASADVIIFVKGDKLSKREIDFADKTSCFVVSSLEEAFDVAAYIFSLNNSNSKINYEQPQDFVKLPEYLSQPFDVDENVIQKLLDKNSFIELYKNMNELASGSSLVTGLATLQGETIGVMADQTLKGGAPDALGTQKFRFFTEFLNKHGIPLLMLSNAPGFVPGTKQERLRIQQIGGESLNVNVLSKIPVVSVVLKQNFGGRLIHAFCKALRPGIRALALEDSMMAVMGASAAFDLFKGREYLKLLKEEKQAEAKELMANFTKSFEEKSKAKNDAYQTGSLDKVVFDIKELRKEIIDNLQISRQKCEEFYS